MGRKRVIKLSKSVKVKCPLCSGISVLKVDRNISPQFFDCKKCKSKVFTPMSKCCIICAYSNKRCSPSLIAEAFSKGLKLK